MALPVIVPLNARRMWILGLAMAAVALTCLGIVLMLLSTAITDGPFWAAVIGFAIFGYLAFFLLGIARAKPVALRMDDKGISGYYAEPAAWADIKRVGVWTDSKGVPHLGFELHDPRQFFDTQTPLRRLITWSNGRGVGFHITLPPAPIVAADVATLAATARRLHAAAN